MWLSPPNLIVVYQPIVEARLAIGKVELEHPEETVGIAELTSIGRAREHPLPPQA